MMKNNTAQRTMDKDMSILGYEQAAGSKKWEIIPSITMRAIEEKTLPEKNGLDDGQKNFQAADATEMSKTEKNIVFEVEIFLGKTRDFINKYLTDILRKMEAIAGKDVSDIFFDLKMEPKKEFNKYQVNTEPELIKLRVEERKARRDLNRFRTDHHLQSNAVYPESYRLHFAFLCVFLLGECMSNMYFFADNSGLGLLGGFFQALVVSIANIGLSYIYGWIGLPQLNHIRWVRKFIGGLSTIVYIGVIGTFHLLVAHFRDLLTIDPDNAIGMTLTRFREAPFSIDTFDSIIVFVIGAIISILAAAKGYAHDDRYPGYGEVDRLHKKQEEAYNQKEAEVRKTLINLFTESETKVDKRLALRESRIREMEDLLSGAKSVIAHIDNIDNQAAAVMNTAIMVYREANKSVRTEAIPAYFTSTPELKNRLNKGSDIVTLEKIEQIVINAKGVLDSARANAKEVIEDLFSESNEISQKIEALAAKVDHRAEDRIEHA